MSNNFRVGQKVVCVDDCRQPLARGETGVRAGRVYTVRGIHPDGDAITLAEVINPPIYHNHEACFYARRFRPAVERSEETGMAILRKLLTDNRVDA